MKRILVPCDFSPTAVQAFELAAEIATISRGEVLVLHAIEFVAAYETSFVAQPYTFNATVIEELEKDAQKNFDEMMRSHRTDPIPVHFYTDHGPIIDTIQQFITDNEIDLVVMGTHGASGMKELFVGSNAEKIVRLSPVPVFSIKSPASLSSIHKIVFPTLPDLHQSHFVNKIKELQKFLDAHLYLLYVNTLANSMEERTITASLNDYIRHYGFNNYTLNIINDTNEENGIIRFSEEINADMIAMATHGRKGLAHFISGSIAEDVVNHVQCPVWTYTLKHHDS
ncbi:universal stress protein [Ohtaekwangia koreensis]|uniref:Nucleotide-binding universal stress protein, UspA family n=1 Tax=Ohtaekwangia koreensis TaxID=688867 RepID=A0A1T5IWZ7_9BACT|nr:universal stress protein [Ohtaekwangia koreensis]SKC43488.1 Nucleotide-binding universal stress protein, UspA family [Ohtaekwangia koreensis]